MVQDVGSRVDSVMDLMFVLTLMAAVQEYVVKAIQGRHANTVR